MRIEAIAYSAALYVFLQAMYNNRAKVKEAKEDKEFKTQGQRLAESVKKIVEARKVAASPAFFVTEEAMHASVGAKTEDERILQDVLPEDDIEEIDFVDDSDDHELMAALQAQEENEQLLEEQMKPPTVRQLSLQESREAEERRRKKNRSFFFSPWDE